MKTKKLVALLGVVCLVASSQALIAQVPIPGKKCPPPPYGTTFCPVTGQILCNQQMISCQNSGGSGFHCGQQINWQSLHQGPQQIGNTCAAGNPKDTCNQYTFGCALTYYGSTCCQNLVCTETSTLSYCL